MCDGFLKRESIRPALCCGLLFLSLLWRIVLPTPLACTHLRTVPCGLARGAFLGLPHDAHGEAVLGRWNWLHQEYERHGGNQFQHLLRKIAFLWLRETSEVRFAAETSLLLVRAEPRRALTMPTVQTVEWLALPSTSTVPVPLPGEGATVQILPMPRGIPPLPPPPRAGSPVAPQRTGTLSGTGVITSADVEDGEVPNFRDWFPLRQAPDVRVLIPSWNRPAVLCENTLAVLRRHGVPLHTSHMFVAPSKAPGHDKPEWYRYLTTFREAEFGEVNLQLGADGLEHQMSAMLRWAKTGYVVIMTDDVSDIMERKDMNDRGLRMRPLPEGLLPSLFVHAHALMGAGGFYAWSLAPCQNPCSMNDTSISRKLVLLEGNISA